MSGGAPKGPRMATLHSQHKKREDKDPEFKQQQYKLSRSFFTPKKPSSTTLPKSVAPSLGPVSLLAAADEIMVGTLAVIPPISTQSGGSVTGSSHLQEDNPPAGPYPSLPMRVGDRKDNEIYFNTGTSRAERWSLRKKVCVCLCDLTGSVVCRGNHPFSRCGTVKAATQTPLTPSLGAVQSGGASHVQLQGLPASSYQTLPPGLADREDGEIYFNTGTSRLERWSRTKKSCVCLCDPTQSSVCIGNLSFTRCGVVKTAIKKALPPTVSTIPQKRSCPASQVVSAIRSMARPNCTGQQPLRPSESLSAGYLRVIPKTKYCPQMLVSDNGRWEGGGGGVVGCVSRIQGASARA